MHRIIVASLLVLLTVSQIGGTWVVYTTAIWIHKQNKITRLSDSQKWQQHRLSERAFEIALVEEDEVLLNGELFDLISVEYSLEGVIITVCPDHAENKMIRTLKGLQQDHTGWSEFAKLAQLFSLTLYETNFVHYSITAIFPSQTAHCIYYVMPVSQWIRNKPDQPPTV